MSAPKKRLALSNPELVEDESKGFTLVELLVVVSIIAILAAVGLTIYSSAQSQTRNARRKADLKDIRTALQLYYNQNQSWPSTGGSYYSSEAGDVVSNNGGNYIPGLAPTYMKVLPRDPSGVTSTSPGGCAGSWKRAYLYRSDGVNYALLAHCAPESTTWTSNDPFYDPQRPTHAWKVCDAEPACSSW